MTTAITHEAAPSPRPRCKVLFSRISRTTFTEVTFWTHVQREDTPDNPTGEEELLVVANVYPGERRTWDYPGSPATAEIVEVVDRCGRRWDADDDLEPDERAEILEDAIVHAGHDDVERRGA